GDGHGGPDRGEPALLGRARPRSACRGGFPVAALPHGRGRRRRARHGAVPRGCDFALDPRRDAAPGQPGPPRPARPGGADGRRGLPRTGRRLRRFPPGRPAAVGVRVPLLRHPLPRHGQHEPGRAGDDRMTLTGLLRRLIVYSPPDPVRFWRARAAGEGSCAVMWLNPAYNELADRDQWAVIERFLPERRDAVLDLGCGTGRLSPRLA